MPLRLAHKVGGERYKLKGQSGRMELWIDVQSEGLWRFITRCQSWRACSSRTGSLCIIYNLMQISILLFPSLLFVLFFHLHLSRKETLSSPQMTTLCCHGYQVMTGKMLFVHGYCIYKFICSLAHFSQSISRSIFSLSVIMNHFLVACW